MAGEIALRLKVPAERIAVAPLVQHAVRCRRRARHAARRAAVVLLHVGAPDMRENVRTLVAAWQAAFPTADVALAFTREPELLRRAR